MSMACSQKSSDVDSQAAAVSKIEQERRPRGERPQFQDLFSRMDSNEDAKLASEEVEGRLKEQFSTIDADSDGFITQEEFENASPPQRSRRP